MKQSTIDYLKDACFGGTISRSVAIGEQMVIDILDTVEDFENQRRELVTLRAQNKGLSEINVEWEKRYRELEAQTKAANADANEYKVRFIATHGNFVAARESRARVICLMRHYHECFEMPETEIARLKDELESYKKRVWQAEHDLERCRVALEQLQREATMSEIAFSPANVNAKTVLEQ